MNLVLHFNSFPLYRKTNFPKSWNERKVAFKFSNTFDNIVIILLNDEMNENDKKSFIWSFIMEAATKQKTNFL